MTQLITTRNISIMSVCKVLLVLSCIILQIITQACDLYDTDTAVCAKDLEDLCGVNSFPDTVQSLYDSRNCLRKNRDLISKECLNYLEFEKPSIVDSCFTEMKTYCATVPPGGFRIHSCLSAVPTNDLSPNCQEALAYDQKIIQERGTVNQGDAFPAAFWSTWAKYLAQVPRMFVEMQIQFTQVASNNLRGSVTYIEIEGNEDEGSIFLADDDNIEGPAVTLTDDEDDDDDTADQKESILAAAGASHELKSTELVKKVLPFNPRIIQ